MVVGQQLGSEVLENVNVVGREKRRNCVGTRGLAPSLIDIDLRSIGGSSFNASREFISTFDYKSGCESKCR
jgi:hypothetical protein